MCTILHNHASAHAQFSWHKRSSQRAIHEALSSGSCHHKLYLCTINWVVASRFPFSLPVCPVKAKLCMHFLFIPCGQISMSLCLLYLNKLKISCYWLRCSNFVHFIIFQFIHLPLVLSVSASCMRHRQGGLTIPAHIELTFTDGSSHLVLRTIPLNSGPLFMSVWRLKYTYVIKPFKST